MVDDIEPAESSAVELARISKTYGDFYALRGLDVAFERGRIHALVGQNGAGKSTCLGLIAGRIAPSEGTVSILGTGFPKGLTSRSATDAGVATVYQELSLFPEMTAIENVFIGQMDFPLGFATWDRLLPRFHELRERLGIDVHPKTRVGALSLAMQQMIEIMRGLALDSRILLLDEPTAVLAPEERASLFKTMRELRDSGVTIIFVSHYLDEVMSISDTVTVFRNGTIIEKAEVARWTEASLVEAMLGEEAGQLEKAREGLNPRESDASAETLLNVSGLNVGKLVDVDITVRKGEIVGIGGLVGSGRSTLLRTLAGVQPALSGRMKLGTQEGPLPRSPRAAWRSGIGYIPEERKTDGLALERTSSDNIIVGDISQVSRGGWIHTPTVKRLVGDLANRFAIPARLLSLPVGRLSGGNQQKVLFARWGLRGPTLLLADESTRGVDIGAKGQIMRMLREMADAGMGVIFVSSDLEEVAAVSDRIYVLEHGRVAGVLDASRDDITQDDILKLAFGIGQNQ
ncbi:sugar ABC transporter ATP-binding protein [Leucobacter japonicus]|uniref:sugar ABC transporter ATP-binding protein n=1 Tax=Leucobacter japonicus TaxID=1461259 RepID=UPI0006A7D557|nr:sugar ABC transporter ATP-binding protein [Leucobacter japonicus]